ncbi:MAG TPA: argininosuccinate synthase [Polyangiaceae bacterium]|nr:argininosuccinate synthase [Polyangiaceae bacterium]
MADKTAVLAFSGGLDTSFCVPYLREKGFEVVTLFVDTGGVDAAERASIERRARALGAREHVTADGGDEVWREVVVPLVMGGQLYQGQYPLLVSDRYVIVRRSLELARSLGTRYFAHGCTGMGNDQVRFDLSVRALGDFEIVAPIRDIQREHKAVRAYEAAFLRERGFEVPEKSSRYTVNENLLGVTMSGAEIDEWRAPGEGTYALTAPPARWPSAPLRLRLGFERGVAASLDGERLAGPELLARLNRALGAYGVGRGIYTGDTVVGLKGRIVFEAPGLAGLVAAHRALEEAVLSREQNAFKPLVASKWVELVYRGFFYEPLKRDLERFLASSQRAVTGEVTIEAAGGALAAVEVESPHILRAAGAVYAQSADWGAAEAEGFIRLLGQSTTLSARLNPPGDDGD